MISIKNIKNNVSTMSCNFYPEADENLECFLVISKTTKEIIEEKICDGCYMPHVGHARRLLATFIDKNEFPKIAYETWC